MMYEMIDIEISKLRKYAKMIVPSANFDDEYTFYYDETNNIKKFYIKEKDFNSAFTQNFILGGLVHEGELEIDIQPLIKSFNLQKNAQEFKFKHIAKGDFLDCLKSNKLKLFLQFIVDNDIYVHYSSLNMLYWAIVDIVDSAIYKSNVASKLGLQFSNYLKNDLYRLSRLEIDAIKKLFYNFEYPNVKKEKFNYFIEELVSIFSDYVDNESFHFGLESLRQLLKEANKEGSLPFIMDNEDFILLGDFSQFFLRPIYLFKNSTHIFDNEDSIIETLKKYKILDAKEEIKNYSFVDSKSSEMIQLSDVFVGIMGKLTSYINTNSRDKIKNDFDSLISIQKENIDLLIDVIDKSNNKNIGFLHSTDSYEEMSKMNEIRKMRGK